MTDRAVSPVVGKALELGVVVLYVGLLSAVLFGHVVPSYRGAAGDVTADRALASAGAAVEAAPVVDGGRYVREVRLPARLAGERYRIRVADAGRALVLDHPDASVGARYRLAVPAGVDAVRGTWRSGAPLRVVVERTENGRVVVHLTGGRSG